MVVVVTGPEVTVVVLMTRDPSSNTLVWVLGAFSTISSLVVVVNKRPPSGLILLVLVLITCLAGSSGLVESVNASVFILVIVLPSGKLFLCCVMKTLVPSGRRFECVIESGFFSISLLSSA